MIRLAFLGAARVLFNAAVLAFTLGALLVYCSYRLVRATVAKDRGQPVRDAGFGTLIACVALVKALQAQGERARPGVTEEVQQVAEVVREQYEGRPVSVDDWKVS